MSTTRTRTSARTPQRIGATVRALRIAHGWTQSELAERARISRRWLIDIEAGRSENARLGMTLSLLDSLGANLSIEAPVDPAGQSQ
jgi:transcriptional regulator with XRE-family HTH domain